MLARCPTCSGLVYESTAEGSALEQGRSWSCVMCGRLVFERTASPPQEWAPARPGRPRKLLTRRAPAGLA